MTEPALTRPAAQTAPWPSRRSLWCLVMLPYPTEVHSSSLGSLITLSGTTKRQFDCRRSVKYWLALSMIDGCPSFTFIAVGYAMGDGLRSSVIVLETRTKPSIPCNFLVELTRHCSHQVSFARPSDLKATATIVRLFRCPVTASPSSTLFSS